MKLSTSTNLICERPDGKILPLNETLRWISTTAIPFVDMSFYEYAYPGQPFVSDNWREWIESAAACAQNLGLHFYQSHAYTYDFLSPGLTEEEKSAKETLVNRSLECCRILGAKVLVTHPSTYRSKGDREKISYEKNRIYFERYVEKADKFGMRLAVENMIRYPEEDYKFFCEPDEINAFIRDLNDDRVGICWDFEHGALLHQDQAAALYLFRKKMIAAHISDTVTDHYEPFMHVLPFTGETDWNMLKKVLAEIGYDGAFSFEAHNFLKRIPDALISPALAYVSALGQFLTNEEI